MISMIFNYVFWPFFWENFRRFSFKGGGGVVPHLLFHKQEWITGSITDKENQWADLVPYQKWCSWSQVGLIVLVVVVVEIKQLKKYF